MYGTIRFGMSGAPFLQGRAHRTRAGPVPNPGPGMSTRPERRPKDDATGADRGDRADAPAGGCRLEPERHSGQQESHGGAPGVHGDHPGDDPLQGVDVEQPTHEDQAADQDRGGAGGARARPGAGESAWRHWHARGRTRADAQAICPDDGMATAGAGRARPGRPSLCHDTLMMISSTADCNESIVPCRAVPYPPGPP